MSASLRHLLIFTKPLNAMCFSRLGKKEGRVGGWNWLLKEKLPRLLFFDVFGNYLEANLIRLYFYSFLINHEMKKNERIVVCLRGDQGFGIIVKLCLSEYFLKYLKTNFLNIFAKFNFLFFLENLLVFSTRQKKAR